MPPKKGKLIDIEDLNATLDRHLQTTFAPPTLADVEKYKPIIDTLLLNPELPDPALKRLKHHHGFGGKNSFLLQIYEVLKSQGRADPAMESVLRARLRIKRGKSHSGVLVITVFTSPTPEYVDEHGVQQTQTFTCAYDCAYCPKEPGQPRSYLKGEPGVLRANKNEFDTCRQMWDRMGTLYQIGHPVDKLEVLVLGGTWSSYPLPYRDQFCRDIYYAANTFLDPLPRRAPLTIQDETRINQSASCSCRVIGLTLETRPDCITPDELRHFRQYGVTRIQMGIQHTDDDVLAAINRRCTTAQAAQAIKLLKDANFKIDAHFMPNLPFSTVEKDRTMFIDQLLALRPGASIPRRRNAFNKRLQVQELYEDYDVVCPELQVDQWKIYSTAITPWTEIEKWFQDGTYVPYPEQDLFDLLMDVMPLIFPWIRTNRVVRDIPQTYIIQSSDKPNMRQEIDDALRLEGKACQCIRSREIKGAHWDGSYILVIRRYDASGGDEYFISAESKDTVHLYGFLRLRIPSMRLNAVFPELDNCALLRELHVYGQLQTVQTVQTGKQQQQQQQHVQHKGIGKTLIAKAKEIAAARDYDKISVIPGEGVRPYYEKQGFHDVPGAGRFMICTI